MNLNAIFRRFSEPVYNTPVAVIAELAGQNTGGAEFANPPYELAESGCETIHDQQPAPCEQQRKPWRTGWKWCVRLFGVYFYISNCRLKRRKHRDILFRGFTGDHIKHNKELLYERQQHLCAMCGQEFEMSKMEYHHILPFARFPELKTRIVNGIVLCHHCHKEIHLNPWKNINMMQAKADELGIDLTSRYEQN